MDSVSEIQFAAVVCRSGVLPLDEHIAEWLGEEKWDVIHFNFGLHDLKQMFDGYYQVSPDDYERNLRRIVFRLKQTGAKLIFATTTPVPEGKVSPPRLPGDVVLYNNRALKVMRENGVEIDDLYSFALPRLSEWQLPLNVHFTEAGSEALGKEVARVIIAVLKKQ
jgi:acyl-CoA thioesterase-1